MRSVPALLVLILQAWLLAALVPLAYATPPDPLWIAGIYDDGDQDDVVVLLVDCRLALADPGAAIHEFVPSVQRCLLPPEISGDTISSPYARRPRSPPSD